MRASLRGIPLLAGLGAPALDLLESHARLSTVPAAHPVLLEGEPGKHVFAIDHGRVRVVKAAPEGLVELARLDEGQIFGEMGLVDRDLRSASVETVTETRLILLPYVAFEILADTQPAAYARVLENLARALVERLRQLDERLATRA